MEKKISIKTLYLLFLISFGLVGLGAGSTYAMFVANAEISNPISFVSNLSYNSDILDIIEIDIEPDETIISTLNVKNNTSGPLNYTAWYIDGGNDIVAGINNGSSTGSITAGNNTSIEVEIRNESTEKVKVTLGVTSNTDNVVIGNNMKIIPNVRISSTMVAEKFWYKSSVDKSTITKITFAEDYTVTGNETESWPAAAEQNSDIIMCYLNGTEITIVGPGRIFVNTDSSEMFKGFSSLTSIENLNLLDTSKTISMREMFAECSSLTSVDLSNFDTSNVADMQYMFSRCNNLSTIYVSLSWNTSAVMDSLDLGMFAGCTSLIGGSGTKYNSSITDATYAKIDGGEDNPGYLTLETI